MKLRNKKTGEIGEPRIAYQEIYVDTTEQKTYCYKSIAKLNEEWEDYKPAEPLIKDEKIRRELSEWIALYGEDEKIKYYRYNDFVIFRLCRKRGTYEPEITLPIIHGFDSLREGKEYTKQELCGEEEE